MKSIKRYSGILGAVLMGFALWSCKEETVFMPEPEDSDKVTVRFLIPENGPTFGYGDTRATDAELESGYLGNGEGAISNLYIVAVQLSYFNYDGQGNYVSESDMSSEGSSGRQRVVVTPINAYDFDGIINKEKSYSLALYPGRYRFYAFANCDLYVNKLYQGDGIYDEDYIKQLALFYSSDVPLRTAHLPMCCTPDRVTYDQGGLQTTKPGNSDKENYTVPIYKNSSSKIHLNLQFMCSKVRYTILFDATQPYQDVNGNWFEGISSGFGNQSIRFYVDETGENRPLATYLRKRTFLNPTLDDASGRLANDREDPFILNLSSVSSPDIPTEPDFMSTREGDGTISYANWPLVLNRYVWPEKGDKYPSRPMDALDPFTGTLDDWKASRQRAWQGVAYLPENQTEGITKTELHFPYVIDTYAIPGPTEDENIPYQDGEVTGVYKTLKLFGNSSETQYEGNDGQKYNDEYGGQLDSSLYSSGLERGYFYDVVARVITPDHWDLKIIVYGQVEPWHEIEQSVTEGPDPNPNPDNGNKSSDAGVSAASKPWEYENHNKTW